MAHPHTKGGPDSGAVSTAAFVVSHTTIRLFQPDPTGTFWFPVPPSPTGAHRRRGTLPAPAAQITKYLAAKIFLYNIQFSFCAAGPKAAALQKAWNRKSLFDHFSLVKITELQVPWLSQLVMWVLWLCKHVYITMMNIRTVLYSILYTILATIAKYKLYRVC